MQLIQDILSLIDNNLGGAMWFAWLLLFTGVFFTIYLKFPQIRYFKHAFRIVTGKYDKKSDAGDTTHYQALATALSGTVGTGNIAGVAFAIFLGGPSALFWMLMTAVVGMTTKFVEVTLSHKYREKTKDGTMAGGPMYYMKHADFRIFGLKLNLKWMAVVFAIATVFSSFGTGSLPQINSIANSMYTTFGLEHWITGAILAVFLALVIIGGIKRIAKVTEYLTPSMAIIYFVGSLLVIVYNYENIIPAIISVFAGAFSGTAAAGGFLGSAMIYAFNRGVNRGLFSNEAGQGSAPIAHAAAKAHEPVSEGMVAILEPFIDTVIICMLTGLVILTSGVWIEKHQNDFQFADLTVLDTEYDENNEGDRSVLFEYLNHSVPVGTYNGDLAVENGKISTKVSLLHARSLAEDVEVFQNNKLFTGSLQVVNGNIQDPLREFHLTGKSLIHSAPLTTVAFTRSFAGEWGKYIVAIGLLLFAFSTAISWSYYGDRAMTFLFGSGSVIYFRIVYVIGFFIASFIDTTIIWIFSGITIALMTLPNLIGLLLLRKEVKSTIKDYWIDFKKDHPNEKTPE